MRFPGSRDEGDEKKRGERRRGRREVVEGVNAVGFENAICCMSCQVSENLSEQCDAISQHPQSGIASCDANEEVAFVAGACLCQVHHGGNRGPASRAYDRGFLLLTVASLFSLEEEHHTPILAGECGRPESVSLT